MLHCAKSVSLPIFVPRSSISKNPNCYWRYPRHYSNRLWSLEAVLWPPSRREQSSTRTLDPGNSRESQPHFFSLDHEKWFSEVSISSRNTRITICNLVLDSKYENGHMVISILSRQVRARKISLDLVKKNCTFSREWDSKSNPITELHSRRLETK